ncbi:MAG: 30S ribosomal protein S20 [Candidatus Omnitrophica bacterium]|nr:30S ribosomal protein S20 [Candidatus Omnitrophota bacterium]
MANLPAAKKSIRKDKKRRLHNKAITSRLKTIVKKINILIQQKNQKEAAGLLKEVMSAFDKAAKKKIIKKNTASRIKSRLSIRVSKITKSA